MRYYNPAIGRFLSKDMLSRAVAMGKMTPKEMVAKGIKLPLNPYAYASNDPINNVDPDGWEEKPAQPKVKPKPEIYILKPGDTLQSVARKCVPPCTVKDLFTANRGKKIWRQMPGMAISLPSGHSIGYAEAIPHGQNTEIPPSLDAPMPPPLEPPEIEPPLRSLLEEPQPEVQAPTGIATAENISRLANIIAGEARGQGQSAREAVAWVVRYRMHVDNSNTVAGVAGAFASRANVDPTITAMARNILGQGIANRTTGNSYYFFSPSSMAHRDRTRTQFYYATAAEARTARFTVAGDNHVEDFGRYRCVYLPNWTTGRTRVTVATVNTEFFVFYER